MEQINKLMETAARARSASCLDLALRALDGLRLRGFRYSARVPQTFLGSLGKVGATDMNATSSRSHSIFALYLHGINREQHSVGDPMKPPGLCATTNLLLSLPTYVLILYCRSCMVLCIWWIWQGLSGLTSCRLSSTGPCVMSQRCLNWSTKSSYRTEAVRSGSTGERLKETQNINRSLRTPRCNIRRRAMSF